MKTETTIQQLRQQFAEAAAKNFGEQIHAFLELCAHPDLEWNDLLDALNPPQFMTNDAALRLHQRLQIPVRERIVELDRPFWENILKERGINPADKCGAFPLIRGQGWVATT
jgi:uncharacterized NAD(P)/FAD-binding protein YdhS